MSLGFSASDLLALPQFAWKVYKACRDSAADFTQLASEIQSMHTVLNELATQHRRRCLTDESISRLVTIQKGCQEILKSVEDQLLKYKNLGTGKKRLRDKLRWSLEGIGNLRLRLISHTNMLTLFIVTLESALTNSHVLTLGTPYKKLNDTVSVVVLEAIHAFQTTFPDRYGFRVKLISKALRYEASDPDNAPVIAAAQKLLILSLVISHKLGIILPIGTSEEVRKYLFHEIGL
ncbi:MAG: hypothetical protein LQ351_004316 [Letrouitia transgressa]|nr:MAG: hypothetical protein LQ351_004316 [Letrouitia transgressa]